MIYIQLNKFLCLKVNNHTLDSDSQGSLSHLILPVLDLCYLPFYGTNKT
jgi:hypothetical protein